MQMQGQMGSEAEDDVLGPAPPDMEERYDAEVGDDQRDAEVKRILRCACKSCPFSIVYVHCVPMQP